MLAGERQWSPPISTAGPIRGSNNNPSFRWKKRLWEVQCGVFNVTQVLQMRGVSNPQLQESKVMHFCLAFHQFPVLTLNSQTISSVPTRKSSRGSTATKWGSQGQTSLWMFLAPLLALPDSRGKLKLSMFLFWSGCGWRYGSICKFWHLKFFCCGIFFIKNGNFQRRTNLFQMLICSLHHAPLAVLVWLIM